MFDPFDLVFFLVGLGVGVGGTWFFSQHYYKRSGDDLRREASELRRLSIVMLEGMEYAGWIELVRDETGRIIHFRKKFLVGDSAAVAATEDPVVRIGSESQRDDG